MCKVAHWTFFSGALDVFLLQDYVFGAGPLLNVNKKVALWTFFSGTFDVFLLKRGKKVLFC